MMPNIAQGPGVQPTLAHEFLSIYVSVPAANRTLLTASSFLRRNRLVTCSAAARSASSNGCPLRAGRGSGSNRIASSAMQ